MKRLIFLILIISIVLAHAGFSVQPYVRIKDISHILQARENQLMGFGLVVGLRNTGDSHQTGFTQQAMTNLLSKMGVTPQVDFKSRNVAAVMVTAKLGPFLKPGQKIDVTVSSLGDATSLKDGTLLLTPLLAPDGKVYAVAQGNILIQSDLLSSNFTPFRRERTTVGRIPGGAFVEKEVPVTFEEGSITIVLNEPDFTTASRMADVITAAGYFAEPVDAATVKVDWKGENLVKIVADIENLALRPDTVAKVVINGRTGTIVIGENVRIADCAVAYANIKVSIGKVDLYSEGSEEEIDSIRTQTEAQLHRKGQRLKVVKGAARLQDLVTALNAIDATPQDLISILQAMKKAGAIKAELEII